MRGFATWVLGMALAFIVGWYAPQLGRLVPDAPPKPPVVDWSHAYQISPVECNINLPPIIPDEQWEKQLLPVPASPSLDKTTWQWRWRWQRHEQQRRHHYYFA